MIIESRFALLDVTTGREVLAKHLKDSIDRADNVPVVITGSIQNVFGHDDGTSQEFTLVIDRINLVNHLYQPPLEHLDAVLHDMGVPQPYFTKQWLREFYTNMVNYKRK